jgi:hypothetical protein
MPKLSFNEVKLEFKPKWICNELEILDFYAISDFGLSPVMELPHVPFL